MNLQTITLDKLLPAEYNPRTITKDEFEGLKTSIKTFGQQENLIVNKDMTIISGHQRFRAMVSLGWTEAVCNLVDLDKHAEKKLNVIMNSAAISGKYDELMLSEILEELKLDDDYESLRLNMLEPLDLSNLDVEEDEAPEVSSEPPVSKLGEIYQLGRHRVMCGDSTDKASVELLMGDTKADMVFTDPPYNVNLKYEDYEDNKSQEDYSSMIKSFVENGLQFTKTMVITPGKSNEHHYYKLFDIKDSMVWYKKFGLSRGSLYKAMVTEPILFIGEKPLNKNFRTDLLEYMTDKVDGLKHACPKPVALIADIVAVLTDKSTITLDLFLGSGSTLIACEQTDRTCYGMELDPKYVDVIRKRYAKYIGKEEEWQTVSPMVDQL